MVAPAPNTPLKMAGYPHECGATFHNGVKVRLLCSAPQTARAFGALCVEQGLRAYEPGGLRLPQIACVPVVNEKGEFIRWKGRYIILLETEDRMNLVRFVNWLRGTFKTPEPEKKQGLLTELADAGEIDTIEA